MRYSHHTDYPVDGLISPVTETYTLAEAYDLLLALDEQTNIIPDTHRDELARVVDTVLTRATGLEINTVGEAIRSSDTLLASVTGIQRSKLRLTQTSADAHLLHQTRNTLLSLALAAVMDYNGNLAEIVCAVPSIGDRLHQRSRPHLDDEMLLMRLWVYRMSLGDSRQRRSAAVFAMVDAGMVAGETTSVRCNDVDLESDRPAAIAPGHGRAAGQQAGGSFLPARLIELDLFNRVILEHHLEQFDDRVMLLRTGPDAEDALLTYRPRKPNASYASRSVTAIQVLDRIAESVGIKTAETTGASIVEWRAVHAHFTVGTERSADLTGRSTGWVLQKVRSVQTEAPKAPRRPTLLSLPA